MTNELDFILKLLQSGVPQLASVVILAFSIRHCGPIRIVISHPIKMTITIGYKNGPGGRRGPK